jgi:hypothetical protein
MTCFITDKYFFRIHFDIRIANGSALDRLWAETDAAYWVWLHNIPACLVFCRAPKQDTSIGMTDCENATAAYGGRE